MPPRRWCAVCAARVPDRVRHYSLDYWQQPEHRLPAALWQEAATTAGTKNSFVNVVCERCGLALRHPYLAFLGDGSQARLVHINSRTIRGHLHHRVRGLIALDEIPAKTALPYPGVLVSEDVVDRWVRDLGLIMARDYAKGGVKERGVKTIIFGQFTPANAPLLCAHLVNCRMGTRTLANAAWGAMPVTDEFCARYPYIGEQARRGEKWPAVRLSRALLPGQELLLGTYGSGYWQRNRIEGQWLHTKRAGTLYRMRFLSAPMCRIRDEAAAEARADAVTKAKRKSKSKT
jgi:hypothetical protein